MDSSGDYEGWGRKSVALSLLDLLGLGAWSLLPSLLFHKLREMRGV